MPFVLSEYNLGQLKALREQGLDYRPIAERLDCSVKTVQRWVEKFRRNPDFIPGDGRCNNPGQPRKVSDEQLEQVVRAIDANPYGAVKRLPQQLDLNVIEQTLRIAIKTRTQLRFRIAEILIVNFNCKI
ncbi:hypothetical protein TKK_0006387 [Trichogramma kaykai]